MLHHFLVLWHMIYVYWSTTNTHRKSVAEVLRTQLLLLRTSDYLPIPVLSANTEIPMAPIS
jgi:hypothetical protein